MSVSVVFGCAAACGGEPSVEAEGSQNTTRLDITFIDVAVFMGSSFQTCSNQPQNLEIKLNKKLK